VRLRYVAQDLTTGPADRTIRLPLLARSLSHKPQAAQEGWVLSVYLIAYTMPMAKTVPVREFRSNLGQLLSDVADRRDHVLVTRNGRPAAVLVPVNEYEALEETAEILSDAGALAALEAGLAEISREETVTLEDLRRQLAERRAIR
jgi:antitoxin YefM